MKEKKHIQCQARKYRIDLINDLMPEGDLQDADVKKDLLNEPEDKEFMLFANEIHF